MFSWKCLHCGQVNRSQRPAGDDYISAKCGKCHKHTLINYTRDLDSPSRLVTEREWLATPGCVATGPKRRTPRSR